MVAIEEPGKKIEESDIDKYCRIIGKKIPGDYRRFLLEYNGGRPEPDYFEIENHFEGEGNVAWFFRIESPVEATDLVWCYISIRDHIIGGYVPIAYSASSDEILLSLRSENFGEVWWYDNKRLWEGATGNDLYFKLADSFSDFLAKFKERPDWD